jgi:hypothetical protein
MTRNNIIILASALVLSALILGLFFHNARRQVNTIRVLGTASILYESDILRWVTVFTTTTGIDNQMEGYSILNRDINRFRDFLREKGFDPNELVVSSANTWANWGDGRIVGHIFEQRVVFTLSDTTRFHEIEKHAFDLSELAQTGVVLRQSSLEYLISTLPELRVELIAEATRDAKNRAAHVAQTTGNRLGRLRTGRIGLFQVTEPHSVEVQGMGQFNTSTRMKQISVTMTGYFELR